MEFQISMFETFMSCNFEISMFVTLYKRFVLIQFYDAYVVWFPFGLTHINGSVRFQIRFFFFILRFGAVLASFKSDQTEQ